MQRPPPLARFFLYPVTSAVALLAIGVTLLWWQGGTIDPLVMDLRAWHGEPWRLVSSALPHVDLFHLAFNVYWLWVFGSRMEAAFGTLRTAATIILLAAGSAAAQHALSQGGIGLSGVGYGLFGFFWVASRTDPRFSEVIDQRTTQLFVAWFILCIALTMLDVWHVANFAHGAGALLGYLLGRSVESPAGRARRLWAAGLAGSLAVSVAGSALARPYINLTSDAAAELAYAGYRSLLKHDYERAANFFERAVRRRQDQAGWWYDLGITYHHLDRVPETIAAYERAVRLEPNNDGYKKALAPWRAWRADEAAQEGNHERARALYGEAVELDGSHAKWWYSLGVVSLRLDQVEASTQAVERAVALDPSNGNYQALLRQLQGSPDESP